METKIGDLVRMHLGYAVVGIVVKLDRTLQGDLATVMWQDSPSPVPTRDWTKDLKAAS